ncbi:uncharacterized protein PSFLO_03454 [Pseudozyma flocculosa]|uniref:Uncharacterized protein n=1 Tax=Pseudozyma flocculosa TaxID=84751 RepID=A0A5C3F2R6_9BASI|nr:uncharacterized protein PSFLO_03454 [Pseudozyma flocculosa]
MAPESEGRESGGVMVLGGLRVSYQKVAREVAPWQATGQASHTSWPVWPAVLVCLPACLPACLAAGWLGRPARCARRLALLDFGGSVSCAAVARAAGWLAGWLACWLRGLATETNTDPFSLACLLDRRRVHHHGCLHASIGGASVRGSSPERCIQILASSPALLASPCRGQQRGMSSVSRMVGGPKADGDAGGPALPRRPSSWAARRPPELC